MPYLIGIDEAGYGLNLGPLVVAATRWCVESDGEDLYAALTGQIRFIRAPQRDWRPI